MVRRAVTTEATLWNLKSGNQNLRYTHTYIYIYIERDIYIYTYHMIYKMSYCYTESLTISFYSIICMYMCIYIYIYLAVYITIIIIYTSSLNYCSNTDLIPPRSFSGAGEHPGSRSRYVARSCISTKFSASLPQIL